MTRRTRSTLVALLCLPILAEAAPSPAVVSSSCSGLAPAAGTSCLFFLAGPSLQITASSPAFTFLQVAITETVSGATLLRCRAGGTSCGATTFEHLSPPVTTLPTGVALSCRAFGASVTYTFTCSSYA